MENYISKDKIIKLINEKSRKFGSRYNLLNYDDITYEKWVKVDDLQELLKEKIN